MTEDEAITKWCPFARVVKDWRDPTPDDQTRIYGPFNRDCVISLDECDSDLTSCIGSQCMAWRETKPAEGYCGLAGKP